MLDAITTPATPPIDVLIVAEQSRLGRDLVRVLYAIQTINEAGVKIFAYLADHEITATGADKLRAIIGGISDEDVVEKTSVRVATKMRDKVADRLVGGGRVYGFRNKKVGKGKTIRVIHDGERLVVIRIFESARDGLGMTRIAGMLNAEGIPGPAYACPPLRDNSEHVHGDDCPRSRGRRTVYARC